MANLYMCISVAALFWLPLMLLVIDSCFLLDIKSNVIRIYKRISAFNVHLI